ncbi:MAG: hypothetical protein ACK4Y4_10295 [Brevundimonas sp.]
MFIEGGAAVAQVQGDVVSRPVLKGRDLRRWRRAIARQDDDGVCDGQNLGADAIPSCPGGLDPVDRVSARNPGPTGDGVDHSTVAPFHLWDVNRRPGSATQGRPQNGQGAGVDINRGRQNLGLPSGDFKPQPVPNGPRNRTHRQRVEVSHRAHPGGHGSNLLGSCNARPPEARVEIGGFNPLQDPICVGIQNLDIREAQRTARKVGKVDFMDQPRIAPYSHGRRGMRRLNVEALTNGWRLLCVGSAGGR